MSDNSKTDEFVALYTNSQRQIYAYIRSQVLSPFDADDILQETSAILWRKFDEFRQGTDFVRWACRIARLEVLTYHRHHKRWLSIFSDEAADAISEKVLELSGSVVFPGRGACRMQPTAYRSRPRNTPASLPVEPERQRNCREDGPNRVGCLQIASADP